MNRLLLAIALSASIVGISTTFNLTAATDKKYEVNFRAILRYPNYRGVIYPGQAKSLKIGFEIQKSSVENPSLSISITDSSGTTSKKSTQKLTSTTAQQNVDIGLENLSAGKYRASAKLVDTKTGAALGSQELPFTIAATDTPLPKVYIDENNRCIVEGKPYFPLGFYTSGSSEKDWDQISAMGFNCILDYGIMGIRPVSELKSHLNQMSQRKLKIIFCLKGCYEIVPNQRLDPVQEIKYGNWNGAFEVFQGLVKNLKDHPAILAWYINDELTDGYLPQILQRYEYIKETDPNHPTYQVLNTVEDPNLHLNYSDVMGFDVYPVLYQCEQKLAEPELAKVGRATAAARQAGMNSRAIWMVPECSSQKSMTRASRPPSYEEVLCESYLALINGARGLIFYHFWELLNDDGQSQVQVMSKVANSLHAIEPIILGIDAPGAKSLKVSDNRISVLTRLAGSGIYALAANPYKMKITCTFTVGRETGVSTVKRADYGVFSQDISVQNGKFSDTIEPYGVRVYHIG